MATPASLRQLVGSAVFELDADAAQRWGALRVEHERWVCVCVCVCVCGV
jgi:hypothetical protein